MIRRRAYTLIETVAAVVVLAVAIPTVASMLADSAITRRDAVTATRATILARAALEHVLADLHSTTPGLGFGALADAPTYLTAPTAGLYKRLAPTVAVYEPLGMSLRMEVSGLVDTSGVVTGDIARDVCRDITAIVAFPPVRSGASECRVSVRVAQP